MTPKVSLLMAHRNGAATVEDAITSALRQTEAAIEVIVADDGSSDGGLALVQAMAAADKRIIVLPGGNGRGPAAARNRALAVARGAWIGALDADDLMHPQRLERLLAAAAAQGAGVIADNKLVFDDTGGRHYPLLPHAFFTQTPHFPPPWVREGPEVGSNNPQKPRLSENGKWIDAAAYARANALNTRAAPLGYLKPLIRTDLLAGLHYNEDLRIAEDYDLVQRVLLRGARMLVVPALTYFYRRHAGSISHRLSADAVDRMLAAHDALPVPDPATRAALDVRRASLVQARAYADIVARLKARDVRGAMGAMIAAPRAALLLRQVATARLRRVAQARHPPSLGPTAFTHLVRTKEFPPPWAREGTGVGSKNPGETRGRPQTQIQNLDHPPTPAPSLSGRGMTRWNICIISRQRLRGADRGSTAYLLAIRDALIEAGARVHLLQPAPGTLGRQPVMRLAPEMAGFASIRIRGAVRVGRFVVAHAPSVWVRLLMGVGPWARRAPYAVAAPWTTADLLYVARHAPPITDAVIADYAFSTAALPYVLRPRARSAVLMHDVFSGRAAQFAASGGVDSVAAPTAAEEAAMLGAADLIVAIQPDEAGWAASRLPGARILTAPMAVSTVPAPQPGQDGTLLFVGSDAAPNTQGLLWFLDAVWPMIRAADQRALLRVAGSVCRAVGPVPAGVALLGVVPNLAPLYRQAGVVISPLRAGSGLKIKLIEAWGHGKAVVATSVTVQGVGEADGALLVADDASVFADHVLAVLRDGPARQALGAAGLARCARDFDTRTCYAELCRALMDGWRGKRQPD